MERTGIRERRIAAPEQALTDLALPAARDRPRAGRRRGEGHRPALCATVTPDMMFPTSSALLADTLGAPRRGGVRPARRLHRLHVRGRPGLRDDRRRPGGPRAGRRRRRPVPHPRLDRPLDACPLRRRSRRRRARAGRAAAGSSASSSAPTGAVASTSRCPAAARAASQDASANGYVHMNGREVFKFATRVLVSSAQAVLERCGERSTTSTSTFPTRQTSGSWTTRVKKLGIPRERMVVNVDRYGNTSSGSIPLAWRRRRRTGGSRKETWC